MATFGTVSKQVAMSVAPRRQTRREAAYQAYTDAPAFGAEGDTGGEQGVAWRAALTAYDHAHLKWVMLRTETAWQERNTAWTQAVEACNAQLG